MPPRAMASFSLMMAQRTFSFTSRAVERAGMHSLAEGQKVSFEVVQDKRSGKNAAENLQAA